MTNKLTTILAEAGVTVGGDQPWDIQVHNPKWFKRVLSQPSLGLGESYMDGWWDCQALDEFFFRVLRYVDFRRVYGIGTILKFYLRNLSNRQSILRSKKVAEVHYNLGNELYQPMLGGSMAYTCAYWRDAEELTEAQNAKYDLVCRKLKLQPGERVLELGCGWGGFAHFAATHYGVEMDSVNISTEQIAYAKKLNRDLPVRLHTCDYRNIRAYNPQNQKFDKVVSIGMCEHVGYKNYKVFMNVVRKQLKDEGLFLLHTIGKNISIKFTDPWIQKYIFPEGMLPTIKSLSAASEGKFVIEDLHNFSAYYDRTLMEWDRNFVASWDGIKDQYDECFYRMWRYYLLSCAGAFRSRNSQLWQFVFSPQGRIGGYDSIR